MDLAGEECMAKQDVSCDVASIAKLTKMSQAKVKMGIVEQCSISRGGFPQPQAVFCRLPDIVLRTAPHDQQAANAHKKSTS